MELKLDRKETEDIILAWAAGQFPGCFNSIHIDAQYGLFRHVDLSFEHPKETEDTPLKAES